MNKHTPGPWIANGNGVWRKDNHNSVAFVTAREADLSPESELTATTKLIAAAPELLEALQDMVEDFWAHYTESDKAMFRDEYPKSHIIKAEAVIKKATTNE